MAILINFDEMKCIREVQESKSYQWHLCCTDDICHKLFSFVKGLFYEPLALDQMTTGSSLGGCGDSDTFTTLV